MYKKKAKKNPEKTPGIICGSRWTNIELISMGNDTRSFDAIDKYSAYNC